MRNYFMIIIFILLICAAVLASFQTALSSVCSIILSFVAGTMYFIDVDDDDSSNNDFNSNNRFSL